MTKKQVWDLRVRQIWKEGPQIQVREAMAEERSKSSCRRFLIREEQNIAPTKSPGIQASDMRRRNLPLRRMLLRYR